MSLPQTFRRRAQSHGASSFVAFAAIVVCGTIAPVHPALAGAVALDRVIVTGDPVPGFEPTFVLEAIGAHPQGESATGGPFDVDATISRTGTIAFHGYVGDDGLMVDDAQSGPSGYFRIRDNVLELVTSTDAPAPGTDTTFVGPGFFGLVNAPRAKGDSITIVNGAGDNVFDPRLGIWSDRNESLEKVILEGESMPGLPPGATVDVPLARVQAEDSILVRARLRGDAFTDLRPHGLWLDDGGRVTPLAITDMEPVGLEPGVLFGEHSTGNVFGPVGTFWIAAPDKYVFAGMTKGPGIGVFNDEAIWVNRGAGVEVLIREGAIPPDPHNVFPGGSVFQSGSNLSGTFTAQGAPPIRMNRAGDVLFRALVDPPADLPRIPTLWISHPSGELELIYRGEQVGVAFSVDGESAPGIPDATFRSPIFANLNESAEVALLTSWQDASNDFFFDRVGIFLRRNDAWENVAFETGPVPDVPGATFSTPSESLRGLGAPVINEDGSVLYIGNYLNDGSVQQGLFRYNVDGTSEPLVERGVLIDVDGRGDLRQVGRIELCEGLTLDGRRLISILFVGGSKGLFEFAAESQSIVGDLNDDGVVNGADLATLLSQWNTDGPADLNGDGVVDGADLATLLANFT